MKPKVLLAVHSLAAGNGGICRVARLMAKALADEYSKGRIDVRAEVFFDRDARQDFPFPVRTASGSQLKYFANVHRATPLATHVLFDSEAMARARVRLPLLKRPWACWIHGVEVWEGAHPRRAQIAMQADCLWSNSEYTRHRASRTWPDLARARVCWLATEDDQARTKESISPSRKPAQVTIIGRLDMTNYKGHDDLIAVWPEVCAVVPAAELHIVGSGPYLPTLQAMAAASPVAQNIHLRGFIPEDQLETVWADTTIFAMPSRGEGFGLVYIEAMKHAIPVVASTADAAGEINIDGLTGLNVPGGDLGALKVAILRLLTDRRTARRFGNNGADRWRRHFQYRCFRERWSLELSRFLGGG